MAKQLIPEELDLLIQEFLTDGIITAKERKVLLDKADSLGLNRDEIDLYIDAQQQKADQAVDAAVKKQRGQTCPFCGGSVPQLTDKCPHCGQLITAEASDELKEIIENLEDALVDLKSGGSWNREKNRATADKYLRKAKLYYGNNPKIKILEEEVNAEFDLVDQKIAEENKFYKKHRYLIATIILICIAIGAFFYFGGAGGVAAFLWILMLGGGALFCYWQYNKNNT